MAPSSSQKGTGKKAGSAASAIRSHQQHSQQQRSRNTTPGPAGIPPTSSTSVSVSVASLPPIETVETETLDLRFDTFRNVTFEDLVDPAAASALIPDSKSLDGIISRLQRLADIIEKRGANCDRGMRLLAQTRRQRLDELAVERGREEERRQAEADDEKKANKKKRKADSLAPGAVNTERSSPNRESTSKARKLDRDDTASSSLSPAAAGTPSNMDVDDKDKEKDKDKTKAEADSDSDSDDGAPPPPPRPPANVFGDDPSTFPDPTVYEIRPVLPGMSEEEIKEIYSVASYPKSDLAHLTCGEPPDRDFSNSKPTNQINFSTFSSYIEPYFRPFTEEDLAFLRERGDRVTPFIMPKRGKKHYTEIWAEEDGAMAIDSSPPGGRDRLPPNQARGSIDNMDDEVAETDKLSVGPLLTRLLQAMRPENRAPTADDKSGPNGTSGDGDGPQQSFDFNDSTAAPNPSQSQPNGVNGVAATTNGDSQQQQQQQQHQSLPPATFMPESNTEAWKKATHPKLDYNQVDERIKQELRHIGFLPLPPSSATDPSNSSASVTPAAPPPPGTTATTAEYDGHYDDEVAARLRVLQARLREQILLNGARKARLTELVKERMAYQEYQTILEDLDAQVNAAYLKRTRTMGKKPKKNRPGQHSSGSAAAAAAAAAGMARPGIGDLARTLMDRRRRWIEQIGAVFDDEGITKCPRVEDGDTSIFGREIMAELIKREKEAWDEEVEEE